MRPPNSPMHQENPAGYSERSEKKSNQSSILPNQLARKMTREEKSPDGSYKKIDLGSPRDWAWATLLFTIALKVFQSLFKD